MYQLAAYLHLLSAIVWVGGMLFLVMVLIPVTRGIQGPPVIGVRVLGSAARKFRVVAWGALIGLVGTGIWLLSERGVSPFDIFSGDGFFYETLRAKVVLVALVLALSATHDFFLGPRLARAMEAFRGASGNRGAVQRQLGLVRWMARVNLVLALAILALGVMLLRGSPF